MVLTVPVILLSIHFSLHVWRVSESVMESKQMQFRRTKCTIMNVQTNKAVCSTQHNQMREENSCEGQSKHGSDLPAGKNAIAVLVIREGLMTAQSRNGVVPGALHQALGSETSAEKGYQFPRHPRNPFYERRKESAL